MDNRTSYTRPRSKSLAVGNHQTSKKLFVQHSVDAGDNSTSEQQQQQQQQQLKTSFAVLLRHKQNLEMNESMQNVNKLSVFQSTKVGSKSATDTLSSLERHPHLDHRNSFDMSNFSSTKPEEAASYKRFRHNSLFGSLQPLSSFSFHKKNAFDFEKTKAKILDPKKDPLSRMRYLKLISEKCSAQEVEDFYKTYFAFVYHTVHECTKTSEMQSAKSTLASSKQQEANDLAIYIFEVLLCCIPSHINRKWQYHSIAGLVGRMLQADILSKTFSDGLRLFVVWYSILMESAEDNDHAMFSGLSSCEGVSTGSVFAFQLLMKTIVTQIQKIRWNRWIGSYNFVLKNFERSYLRRIFPKFQQIDYSAFKHETFANLEVQMEGSLWFYQRIVINWLAAIIGTDKRSFSLSRENVGVLMKGLLENLNSEEIKTSSPEDVPSTNAKSETASAPDPSPVDGKSLRNSMSFENLGGKKNTTTTPSLESKYQFVFSGEDRAMMQGILFSDKSNTNMVLEIFHQVFAESYGRSPLVREILIIYKQWIKGQQTPCFIQQCKPNSPSTTGSRERKVDLEADAQSGESGDFKIGKQTLIQIFVSQSCTLFFCNWNVLGVFDKNSNVSSRALEQINVCNQSLNLYRYLVMDVPMDTPTWSCLLERLMKICRRVVLPTSQGLTYLDDLSKKIIETLVVAFVKASLNCHVGKKLWEQMSGLMISLADVYMVVHHWGSTMVMLTKMLGYLSYNIDLEHHKHARKKKLAAKKTHFQTDVPKEGSGAALTGKDDRRTSEMRESPEKRDLPSTSSPGEGLPRTSEARSDVATEDFSNKSNVSDSSGSISLVPDKIEVHSFSVDGSILPEDSAETCSTDLPRAAPSVEEVTFREVASKRDADLLGHSESSDSLENSVLNESLSKATNKMDRSLDSVQEITREHSNEDKQVEMDLTEMKECSVGGEGIRTVWVNMLCIFGNVASTADCRPLVVQNLKPVHDCLLKIYRHPDFVDDNKYPILMLVPWLLEIIHTPDQVLPNKLIAYSMMCDYLFSVPLHTNYLSRFYFSIHVGLQCPTKDVPLSIVRQYSKQIFGQHRGWGIILLEGFLRVVFDIINLSDDKTKSRMPDKIEASRILASCANIPNHHRTLMVLDPDSPTISLKPCHPDHLKDTIIRTLIALIDEDQSRSGVCSISIRGLGIYLHEELTLNPTHPLIPLSLERLSSIFSEEAALCYSNVDKLLVTQIFSSLRDHHSVILGCFRNVLRSFLEHLMDYLGCALKNLDLLKEFQLIHCIFLCLLEWFLILPTAFLLENVEGVSLLERYLKILNLANCDCAFNDATSADVEASPLVPRFMLLINFISSHLTNHVGCSSNEGEAALSDSQSQQLLIWYGIRTLEVMNCPSKSLLDDQLTVLSTFSDFSLSPHFSLNMRDLTGRWLWFIQCIDNHRRDGISPCDVEEVTPSNRPEVPLNDGVKEDFLIKALNFISETSPECCPTSEYQSLTVPFPCSKLELSQDFVVDAFVEQHSEVEEFLKRSKQPHFPCKRPSVCTDDTSFNSGMLMKISQAFGFFQSKERQYLDFLKNGEQLLREMKHFDSQRCHETHKVAVIYIAANQNNKTDILLNDSGSRPFQEFYSQLGEMVNLRRHKDFLGGLSTTGATGERAPYYSPSTLLQVIFHVSTLLHPSQFDSKEEDTLVTKMRHIGNDEVHIVWTESRKCYTVDVLPTSFGEVTIVIYPLPKGLFRIQIIKKIMMDAFGPLFDGAIVGKSSLPALVRATAVNAGRAIRETRSHYQNFYEERYSTLWKIANTYRKQDTYENFLHSIMMPGAERSSPLSYLRSATGSNSEAPSDCAAKQEKSVKNVRSKKQKTEFLLPLKTKSEK